MNYFYLRNKLLYGKWKRRIIKKLNKIKILYEITLDDVNKLIDSAQYTEIPATHEKLMILKIIVKKHINLVNKINDMFFVVKLKK